MCIIWAIYGIYGGGVKITAWSKIYEIRVCVHFENNTSLKSGPENFKKIFTW